MRTLIAALVAGLMLACGQALPTPDNCTFASYEGCGETPTATPKPAATPTAIALPTQIPTLTPCPGSNCTAAAIASGADPDRYATPTPPPTRMPECRGSITDYAYDKCVRRVELAKATPTKAPQVLPTPRFGGPIKVRDRSEPQWCDALGRNDRMGSPRQIVEGKIVSRESFYSDIPGYNTLVAKMTRSELVVNGAGSPLLHFLHHLKMVEKNLVEYRDNELNDLRGDIFDYLRENLDYSADGDVWFDPNRRGLLIRHEGRFVSEYDDGWSEAQESVRAKIRDLHPHMERLVDHAKSLCPSMRTLGLQKPPSQ